MTMLVPAQVDAQGRKVQIPCLEPSKAQHTLGVGIAPDSNSNAKFSVSSIGHKGVANQNV